MMRVGNAHRFINLFIFEACLFLPLSLSKIPFLLYYFCDRLVAHIVAIIWRCFECLPLEVETA